MSTLHQIREGMHGAIDALVDGWQRLYQHAKGAIIRFRPGSQSDDESASINERELSIRSVGWGIMAAEVFDDNETIRVRLEAPGMNKEDFDLQVNDEYLVVRGEKRISSEQNKGQYHITERAYGCFERAIPLPDEVDADRARAKYKRGVLEVELPRTSRKQRTRITVNDA